MPGLRLLPGRTLSPKKSPPAVPRVAATSKAAHVAQAMVVVMDPVDPLAAVVYPAVGCGTSHGMGLAAFLEDGEWHQGWGYRSQHRVQW